MRYGFMLVLAACATSKSSESSFSGEASRAEARDVTRRVEKGPVRTTVVEEEFGDGTGPGATLVVSPTQRESPAGTSSVVPAVPATGRLIRRVTTIREQAPTTSTTEAKSTSTQQGSLQGESASQSAFRFGLGFWTKVLIGVALAAAAWLAWKFRGGILKRFL